MTATLTASRVRVIAATLGIDVTGVGEAAVSGTVSPSLYQLRFRVTAAGHHADIAEPLCELVESVSILPAVRQP